MSGSEGKRATTRNAPPPRLGKLRLLVLWPQRVLHHWLPPVGSVVIGRGAECDIQIDDPSISRRHAVLHIGPPMAVEDLGSFNGTRVHGVPLEAHQVRPLAVGDGFMLASTMLVVQEAGAAGPQRRLWALDYFEARLDEERARAERTGARFCVLHIHGSGAGVAAQIEEILSAGVRGSDVIAHHGADYQVLLIDTDAATAEVVARRLRRQLAAVDDRASLRVSAYPAEQDADDLADARDSAKPTPRSPPRRAHTAPPATMEYLAEVIEAVAATKINILIMGETGVGKEFMAERIHALSPRAARPLLRLNCAALTPSLIESELFGHARGAFTGAVRNKLGLLVTAEGGTVFLDEIGELPLELQAKLLRVLDERKVMPVGSVQAVAIDVRFIAATNRELEAEVARGGFRQDLYFRLNGFSLVVPPLRERPEELEKLTLEFIAQASHDFGRARPPAVSDRAMELLLGHSWPGNVRELRNVIERAVALSGGGDIEPGHLPFDTDVGSTARPVRPRSRPAEEADAAAVPAVLDEPVTATIRRSVESIERERILDALERAAGNQTTAAKLLGLSRRTLIDRLDRYGIQRPRKGRARPG